MDGSQYHPNNGMSNNNSPYLPNISPHQLQQTGIHHTTLPPLQATQHATMSSHLQYPGSAPHTPRTPATPGTPVSGNNMGNFPQMAGQHQQQQQQQQQRYQQMMPTSSYQQPAQAYRTAGSMMPQSSMSMSHPQPIAPAPLQNRANQPLRPMPPHGLQQMQGGMQGYGQNNMGMMQDMEPPTHVVGSQGRRGILPSAPGRPAVSATGTGKNALIPAKDADGKFPCPHCTKTYLHAKHLKRHLLRHTGDRPYMCVLCRDTFSRSDILKRHFQKCSIRRGNPTGASHLSHAQAHLKKSHPGPHKSTNSMPNENELMGVNGMNGGSLGPNLFGISPDGTVPDAGSNMTDEQSEQLRARAAVIGGGRDGNRMTGPSPGGSNRASFEQQNYAGPVASMPSGMNPSVAFNLNQGQNGHSYNQGYDYASHGNSNTMQQPQPQPPAGQDWSHMFHQQPPQPGYMPYNSNIANPQIPIKTEFKTEPSISNSNNGLYTAIYPGVHPNSSTNIPSWNLQNDPLEDISSRLIFFCFPQNQIIGRANDIRKYLSASNIKHFLELFTSFQGHFPIIHMPTFRIGDAFDGLLLAMICIGAVYSDRLSASQARDMMELSKSAIERNSQVFSVVTREQTGDSGFGGEAIGSSKSEMEQITAIFMMQIMSCWHGTPIQREKARREFHLIIDIARRAGLTKTMTISPFSVLHQPNVTVENFSAASFDWSAWVEQEKRSRLMFAIYLLDCAMVIFFNASPMFERDEIRLPLPADDAAWDAASSSECAEALGLHGPAAARAKNSEGSRRPKQPELPVAMKTLMHGDWLQPGTTNLYSKFILVHALHIQLWSAQRQLSLQESGAPLAFSASGTATPVSHDWRNDATGSGQRSANTSGRGTPVDSAGQLASVVKSINNAFDKWKKAWDEDMSAQYPPSSSNYRRFGFCRDAVHFYWLAKYLLQSGRSLDAQMAPDQRFGQVMNLLKSVKTWVQTDSVKRGEELGSVNDIDKDYGVLDLTLDMAQLFKPINQQIDSPVPGVQTNIGNTIG